jgi:hypothetical protein
MRNGLISYGSKKQSTVALSSTEAEYYTLTEGARDVTYLRMILDDLGYPQSTPITIFTDNEGTVKLTRSPVFHSRTKHIARRQHFIREKVEEDVIAVVHLPMEENAADVLTKGLGRVKFTKHIEVLGVVRL